jgi:hypothetical protein
MIMLELAGLIEQSIVTAFMEELGLRETRWWRKRKRAQATRRARQGVLGRQPKRVATPGKRSGSGRPRSVVREALLKVMEAHPDRVYEVADFHGPPTSMIRGAMRRAAQAGEIEKVGYGRYRWRR